MRIIAILGLLPFMYKLQVNFCTVVAADTKLVLALVSVSWELWDGRYPSTTHHPGFRLTNIAQINRNNWIDLAFDKVKPWEWCKDKELKTWSLCTCDKCLTILELHRKFPKAWQFLTAKVAVQQSIRLIC